MRDLETISTAITAAETGHLVFGTLHTRGLPVRSTSRIVDVFPPEQQEQIRIQLAEVLRVHCLSDARTAHHGRPRSRI